MFYFGRFWLRVPTYYLVVYCLYFSPPSIKVHVFILVVCVWQKSLYIYRITGAPRALPTCTNGMITLNFVNRPKVSSMYIHYPERNILDCCMVYVRKTLSFNQPNHKDL